MQGGVFSKTRPEDLPHLVVIAVNTVSRSSVLPRCVCLLLLKGHTAARSRGARPRPPARHGLPLLMCALSLQPNSGWSLDRWAPPLPGEGMVPAMVPLPSDFLETAQCSVARSLCAGSEFRFSSDSSNLSTLGGGGGSGRPSSWSRRSSLHDASYRTEPSACSK